MTPTTTSDVPVPAKSVARYLLHLERSDGLTNLKLQKLLYYCQGAHLALFDEPMFADEVQAWDHGPVIPDVYHEYKKWGSGLIRPPKVKPALTPRTESVINEVHEVYGQFSGWRLRELTHLEPPWLNTYQKGKRHHEISRDAMKAYFKTRLR